jgi:hypothetical protein
LVHQAGHLRILEGFVLHHVAPVTGGVADRQEDRLILLFGDSESLLPPRIPIHGVVGVLQQVGALLVLKTVQGWFLFLGATRGRGNNCGKQNEKYICGGAAGSHVSIKKLIMSKKVK